VYNVTLKEQLVMLCCKNTSMYNFLVFLSVRYSVVCSGLHRLTTWRPECTTGSKLRRDGKLLYYWVRQI